MNCARSAPQILKLGMLKTVWNYDIHTNRVANSAVLSYKCTNSIWMYFARSAPQILKLGMYTLNDSCMTPVTHLIHGRATSFLNTLLNSHFLNIFYVSSACTWSIFSSGNGRDQSCCGVAAIQTTWTFIPSVTNTVVYAPNCAPWRRDFGLFLANAVGFGAIFSPVETRS